jgi:hypothetical protein
VNKAHSADVDTIRACTWDIVMAGGYIVTGFGTTYFGGNRCRGPFDVDAPKNDDWEAQLQHVRAFFTAREWWKLEPRDDLITAPVERTGDEEVVGDRRGRPPRVAYWALAEPGRQYVAYMRGCAGPYSLALDDAAGTYRMREFDPRMGAWREWGIHDGAGPVTYTPPDAHDWVLLVTARESRSLAPGADIRQQATHGPRTPAKRPPPPGPDPSPDRA